MKPKLNVRIQKKKMVSRQPIIRSNLHSSRNAEASEDPYVNDYILWAKASVVRTIWPSTSGTQGAQFFKQMAHTSRQKAAW